MELFLLIISTTFIYQGMFAVGISKHSETFLTLNLSKCIARRMTEWGSTCYVCMLQASGKRWGSSVGISTGRSSLAVSVHMSHHTWWCASHMV